MAVAAATGKGIWTSNGPASPDESLTFRIALKQRNLDQLAAAFWRVSSPHHRDYGKHLTKEQVLAIIAPPAEDVASVLSWLRTANITKVHNRGDVLEVVEVKAAQVEWLLGSQLHRWTPAFGQDPLGTSPGARAPHVLRLAGVPLLAAGVSDVVESFMGLEDAPMSIRRRGVMVGAEEGDGHPYTYPYTLRNLYGMDATRDRITNPAVTQGVAAFEGLMSKQGFDQNDLDDFFAGTGETPTLVTKIVGNNPGRSAEGSLDIQYISTIGSGAATQFWTTSGTFVDQANDIFNTDAASRPLVYSVSYGIDEHQYQKYITRCDTEYMKLGTVGVSVLVASGDDGANGDEACLGTYPLMGGGYPATSPYVTSVGATQQDHNATHPSTATTAPVCSEIHFCADGTTQPVTPEYACSHGLGSLITTGGGFSYFTDQPSYQKDAVLSYLKSGVALPSCTGCYDPAKRAYPDISANGDYFLLRFPYKDAKWCSSAGTSASTPVVAGIISQLNNKRLAGGKAPLGFLNPMLYSAAQEHPSSFTDITIGDNEWSRLSHCKFGYKCTKGWDPVTGLGTPNYPELSKYLLSLDGQFQRGELA